jgi:hypothetical protein
MPKRVTTSVALSLMGAAAVLVLAGCTSGTQPEPDPTPTNGQGEIGTEEPAPPFTGEQGPVPDQADIADDPDLREIVLMTGCEASDGGWAATGTAENPESSDVSYTVVVIFTDAQARNVTSSTVEIPVAAGGSAEWEAAAEFDPPEGTQCVLAGVANTAG